ncbi:MAG TPA: hypothetical protein P5511_07380, partial [Candidatus Goldiibacteriota bacterium]|nr:hypothetical protein [Candidatus Goldiibacteriota bacterium]
MRLARKAEKTDLEALGRVEEDAFADKRRRRSIALSVSEGLCWIMFDGKKEAGFLTIDSLSVSECHIGLIAVHSCCKKRGIASFLLKYV